MEPRLGIYIAGPMRGIPEWNFPAFHQVHDEWVIDPDAILKIFWFCPACQDEQGGFRTDELSGGEDLRDLGFDLRRALGKDLAWIAKNADVVVVLPGWENSKGAQAEVALAHALDIIVTAYDHQADGFGPHGEDLPASVSNVIPFIPDYLQPVENLRGLFDEPAPDRPVGLTPVEGLWANGNDYGYAIESAEVHDSALGPEEVKEQFLRDGEVRVTSSTGGQKGTKLARFELIPAGPLWQLAELYGKGAAKYEDRNWERGYAWSLSYGAAMRHMVKFWSGEDYDSHNDDCPEDCVQHTELPHVICAVFHMFGLAQFMEHNNDFDDRPIR